MGPEERYLAIAAARWRDGISRVRLGLIGLSEAAMDEESRDLLQLGLIDLRVGDTAFAAFVEGLDPEELSSLGLEFPAVAFVPAGGETLFDAEQPGGAPDPVPGAHRAGGPGRGRPAPRPRAGRESRWACR